MYIYTPPPSWWCNILFVWHISYLSVRIHVWITVLLSLTLYLRWSLFQIVSQRGPDICMSSLWHEGNYLWDGLSPTISISVLVGELLFWYRGFDHIVCNSNKIEFNQHQDEVVSYDRLCATSISSSNRNEIYPWCEDELEPTTLGWWLGDIYYNYSERQR